MDRNNTIIGKLLGIGLPAEDYIVFGSGAMFAHGINVLLHDVDVIARGKAWEKAKKLGEVKKANLGNNDVVVLFDGEVEIFNGWAPGEWDVDELIDNADIIDGVKYASLNNIVMWKLMMGREKDLQHIKIIEDFLAGKQ